MAECLWLGIRSSGCIRTTLWWVSHFYLFWAVLGRLRVISGVVRYLLCARSLPWVAFLWLPAGCPTRGLMRHKTINALAFTFTGWANRFCPFLAVLGGVMRALVSRYLLCARSLLWVAFLRLPKGCPTKSITLKRMTSLALYDWLIQKTKKARHEPRL